MELATNPAKYWVLRKNLLYRRFKSALFDTAKGHGSFVEGVEQLFAQYCGGRAGDVVVTKDFRDVTTISRTLRTSFYEWLNNNAEKYRACKLALVPLCGEEGLIHKLHNFVAKRKQSRLPAAPPSELAPYITHLRFNPDVDVASEALASILSEWGLSGLLSCEDFIARSRPALPAPDSSPALPEPSADSAERQPEPASTVITSEAMNSAESEEAAAIV